VTRWTVAFAIVTAIAIFGLVVVFAWTGAAEGANAFGALATALASAGFLFLLAWASFGGRFRDVERPKQRPLDAEPRWGLPGER
jgi:hypothetical protein